MSKLRDTSRPCTVCREPIRPGALKCVKCGSYQSAWRPLLSAPHMSMAIAVIAATSVWWGPALKDLQSPKGAVLKTSFGGVYGVAVGLSVTNIGTMPGAVQTLSYAYGNDQEITSYPLRIQDGPLVVEPNKTILVKGTLPLGVMFPPYPDPTKKCAVEAFLTGPEKQTVAHRDFFECIFVIPALNEGRRIMKEQGITAPN